jgi:hypothetical protein
MTKMLIRAALAAAACLLMTAGHANASEVLQVKVPFPFVVNGQTLPAGQYSVERDDFATSILLIRGEKGNHASAFIKTTPAMGQDPKGDQPSLQFKRHENDYKLSTVWESRDEGLQVMK